ncbi:cytochrome o ubiquinol/quinol oxidase subunit IV [Methylocella sp.]|uniref:cytochrome o ubiquinol/quinol oxidase subunit IV n=1 Tax=Methylocella sp. TaxID=1978226 RepID=UPI0037851F4F
MSGPHNSRRDEIRSYVTGYSLALALTCAAFASVHWRGFTPTTTLCIVFGLALLQIVVHFRYFLHISLRRSARDDLLLILFSTLIVILMVSGTLVVLFNLRERMM